MSIKFRCMLPCAARTCAVRPVFVWGQRELLAADLSKSPRGHELRSAKTHVSKSKTRVPKHAFSNTASRLLLFSIRHRFGLRAKDARAENPLVNNGVQQNAETACVLGCVLKTLDDRQITHLICVRLRHLLYDFFGGVFCAFYKRETTGRRRQTAPKKSYRKCFRRTQIG